MKDRLERQHGMHHELFDWRNDWRWPDNGIKGDDLKRQVAILTFARVAGRHHQVQVIAADGWSKWDCPFYPSKRLTKPLCVVRVNLRYRQSQYLGWLSESEFEALDVVDVGYKQIVTMRRVVLDWMLHRGLPECVCGRSSDGTESGADRAEGY